MNFEKSSIVPVIFCCDGGSVQWLRHACDLHMQNCSHVRFTARVSFCSRKGLLYGTNITKSAQLPPKLPFQNSCFILSRQPVTKKLFRHYRVLGKGGFGEVSVTVRSARQKHFCYEKKNRPLSHYSVLREQKYWKQICLVSLKPRLHTEINLADFVSW